MRIPESEQTIQHIWGQGLLLKEGLLIPKSVSALGIPKLRGLYLCNKKKIFDKRDATGRSPPVADDLVLLLGIPTSPVVDVHDIRG